ncbi:MAG TPA: hypothetical protein VF623_13905 [Segetibacter sp.]|jgi:hypothetical protein
MKTIRTLTSLGFIFLVACNAPVTKKVLVVGRGKLAVKDNEITMSNGSGYAEETVDVTGDKEAAYTVTTPSGKTTVTIPAEKGFYILNLKTDTLVGSQQMLGTNISSGHTITQEELKANIDSLTKLTAGQNVSAAAHNYFILPQQVAKISANEEAKVFGPFSKIPATLDAGKDGKAPEIYKFYTNTEMRQLITNFKKMTY